MLPCSENHEALNMKIFPDVEEKSTGEDATSTCKYFPRDSDQQITKVTVKWYKSLGPGNHILLWTASNTAPDPNPIAMKGDFDANLSAMPPTSDLFFRCHELTIKEIQLNVTMNVYCSVDMKLGYKTEEGNSSLARLVIDGE